jgi:uncharacterized protein (DUF58 family)
MFKRSLYRSFRLLSSIKNWLTGRFTKGGLLVLGGLILSAAVGLNINLTMAYQIFTFLFSLLLIAIVWSRFFRVNLRTWRILPRFATEGERFTYRVLVENKTQKIQRGLSLIEKLDDPRPTFEELLETLEPGEKRRNPFDRIVGYHRWQWLVSKKQGGKVEEQVLPALPPNSEGEVLVEIVPALRGRLNFTGFTIARPDPLGLYKSFATIPVQQSVLVLPKRYPLPPIQIPGTRRYQPGGVALAHSVGDSEEFISLRDYRPGDPLRRIHWKSWAKTGKPIVREYQDEFFVRHGLVLDTFLKAEYSEAFEEAVSIAASFVSSIQTQESLLDLMFVGPEAYCFTSGRGIAHMDRMLEILASVRTCKDKPFSTLPPLVLERSSLLSGCICVLLSWDEERKGLVHLLQQLGIPPMVLVVTEADAGQPLDPELEKERPDELHFLKVGKIEEGLANL